MSDAAEVQTTPVPAITPAPVPPRPSRLTQAVAWVGIIAGVVFVVSVIFFSGFVLGKTSGGEHHGKGHHGGHSMSHHQKGPSMGQFGPSRFMFPGGPGESRQGPAPTTAPTPAPARP